MSNYIIPFLIGGCISSGIKYTGQQVSTKLAGVIGAFPLGLLSSYFITSIDKTNSYLNNYSIMLIVLFISVMIYRYLLYDNINRNYGLVFTFILWAMLGFICYKYTNLLIN